MNIFPTDPDPFLSAYALDDKRLVRQASEATVILGGVMALLGHPTKYQKTRQPNHKLIRWLVDDPAAWQWTATYAFACSNLYAKRYGRELVCFPELERMRAYHRRAYRPTERPSSFCNAASNRKLGVDFTSVADVHEAYRKYLRFRWGIARNPPMWSAGGRPEWADES